MKVKIQRKLVETKSNKSNHFYLYSKILLINYCVITHRRVDIPSEFFEFISEDKDKNFRLYKCLFEGCIVKKKHDGSPKYLSVSNKSRSNAKRHFLVNNYLSYNKFVYCLVTVILML